jgi:hypothetical protein
MAAAATPSKRLAAARSHAALGQWAVIGVLIALLWTSISFNLWRDHHQAQRQASADTGNLARAFEENINRTIEAVDQTALFVRDAYARDPTGFDLSTWARARPFLNELAIQIGLVDKNGIVLQSNLGPITDRVDLSDRPHFRVHLNTPADRLYISVPVLGRVSHKWSIQFTRKIIMPDGSFGGVVVVSLDPYYLSRFYESLHIGNGAVVLANIGGVILARVPNARRVTCCRHSPAAAIAPPARWMTSPASTATGSWNAIRWWSRSASPTPMCSPSINAI